MNSHIDIVDVRQLNLQADDKPDNEYHELFIGELPEGTRH